MKKVILITLPLLIIVFPVIAKEIKCETTIEKYKDELTFAKKVGKISISEKNGHIKLYTKYIPYEFYNRKTVNFLKECMLEIYHKLDCNGQKELKGIVKKDKSNLFNDFFKLKTVAVCKVNLAESTEKNITR